MDSLCARIPAIPYDRLFFGARCFDGRFFSGRINSAEKEIIIEKDKIELTEDDKLNAMIREANNYISQMRKADWRFQAKRFQKK
jgi:hypothetical protein